MNTESSTTDLFRSCEVLFGSELTISAEFLEYLQISGVKSAYRKRAMETHPDRCSFNSLAHQQEGEALFHAVQEAYNNLLHFLKEKETGRLGESVFHRPAPRPSPQPYRPQSAGPTQSGPRRQGPRASARPTFKPIILPDEGAASPHLDTTESLYVGGIPDRPLLFGHFLYYSGLTNWRTVARILIWQRTERPRLGELGERFGIFAHQDIAAILRHRKPFRPFGQTARKLGLLTEFQLKMLISQQQRLQKKFGTILLEKNLITSYELQKLLDTFEQHNASILAKWR